METEYWTGYNMIVYVYLIPMHKHHELYQIAAS